MESVALPLLTSIVGHTKCTLGKVFTRRLRLGFFLSTYVFWKALTYKFGSHWYQKALWLQKSSQFDFHSNKSKMILKRGKMICPTEHKHKWISHINLDYYMFRLLFMIGLLQKYCWSLNSNEHFKTAWYWGCSASKWFIYCSLMIIKIKWDQIRMFKNVWCIWRWHSLFDQRRFLFHETDVSVWIPLSLLCSRYCIT